ncbi:hypothetical protein ACFL6C_03760, partial [Myxococcota bacterium]
MRQATCISFLLVIVSGTARGDQRISAMGTDGDSTADAYQPAVAYNATDDELLVVWAGRQSATEFSIYGQRLAADGTEIGADDFRIDFSGGGCSMFQCASDASVVWNSIDNEYLVVYRAERGPDETFVQRIDGTTGALIGGNVQISEQGDVSNGVIRPAVAHNVTDNEYLVVWGDDNFNLEKEIYGQRLNTVATEIGSDDFRISDAGVDGDTNIDALWPDVAWNSVDNEYLVVWESDENVNEEVFVQRLDNAGNEIGVNDVQITTLGARSNSHFGWLHVSVTHDPANNLYLVVFVGNDSGGGMGIDETEIYGQLLTNVGAETGPDDFRISFMGAAGNSSYHAWYADVAVADSGGTFNAVWHSDDNTGGVVDNELEIFSQLVDTTGTLVGSRERISNAGPLGDPSYDANGPAIVFHPTRGDFFCAWSADHNQGGIVDDEYEIFISTDPDSDGDGVPDSIDICPGFDDRLDDDGDTVPDGCDVCPGADDTLDTDMDTVPDGCDACPGLDDMLDDDGDTVPDGCDACAGFDDMLDDDGDTVPDGCDACA